MVQQTNAHAYNFEGVIGIELELGLGDWDLVEAEEESRLEPKCGRARLLIYVT